MMAAANAQAAADAKAEANANADKEAKILAAAAAKAQSSPSGLPFSVGEIKVTNSVPDNKPPSQEDTIEGRYATVLFVAASEQESMFAIFEDFSYLDELYTSSEAFR
jgi:hypothetical protein